MICHITFSIDSTNTWTWIYTFLVYASFGFGAIGVENTFGTTFNIGISRIFGNATARTGTILFLTNGIYAAWARIARHWNFDRNWGD